MCCHSLRGSVDWNSLGLIWFLSNVLSLPSRECGLKFPNLERWSCTCGHSLRGSVDWNDKILCHVICCWVTPFAGVWIEIGFNLHAVTTSYTSLPSRECGLKYRKKDGRLILQSSLPSRECGLKFLVYPFLIQWSLSLPSRECGLKLCRMVCIVFRLPSLPSRECGLKLAGLCSILAKMWSLPSRECGLKSTKKNSKSQWKKCHSLRGSVDWNWLVYWYVSHVCVTPFAGVWIEIGRVIF